MRTQYRLCMNIALLLFIALSSVSAQSDSTVLQLAQKEQEFSQSAAARGFINAFRAYFDDSCISFYPQPENAKHALIGEPESQASLVWWPTFVEVSASDDFGFTTGPSEYRAGGISDSLAYYGHFVSVWKKNSNGKWDVILDVGNSYPKEEKRMEKFKTKQLSSSGMKKVVSVDEGLPGMMAADSSFSFLVQTRGAGAALQKFASDDIRVYRKGTFPTEEKSKGLDLVRNEKPMRCGFYAGNISSSGDLGFTCGVAVEALSDTSSYIRIWEKENEWKVVVDIVKPWNKRK
jgi:hypothetical protein